MNKGQNKIFPKHLFHLDQKSQDLWDFAAGAFVFRGIGAYEIVGPPASRNPGIRIGGMSDINTNFFGRKIPKDQQKLPTKKSSKKKGLMLPSCFLDVLTFFCSQLWLTFETQIGHPQHWFLRESLRPHVNLRRFVKRKNGNGKHP